MRVQLKVLSLAAAGCLSANNAHAADIVFNFLVNSSGADIYACDAGLYDPAVSGSRGNIQARAGAYNNGNTPVSWTDKIVRSNIVLPAVQPFYTVASAPYATGTAVLDRLNNVIANPNVSGDPTPDPATATSAGRLTFNLGSDTYGSNYFVDFCYRGSKLSYPAGAYVYNVYDSVTAADISSGQYLTNALLDVQGRLVCDKRTGVNGTDFATTLITDDFGSEFLGLGGVPLSQIQTTTADGFSGAAKNVFGTLGSPTAFTLSGAPAKYCVIRYIFREKATAKRKWDINSANFTIDLHVNNVSFTPSL